MTSHPEQNVKMTLEQRACEQFEEFLDDCGLTRQQVQGRLVLELGFGNGLFLDQCRRAGMRVQGLEVRPAVYEKTRRQFGQLDLCLYDGCTIPAEDGSVDFVVSFQVFEHVESLDALFAECVRVLGPNGYMYHRMPNYQSFYEGHYKVLWWPFLTKTSGRWYLKCLGRYTDYYESLNILKPSHVRRLCRDNHIELLSDGKKQFQKMFTVAHSEKIKNRLLRGVVVGFCRIRPLRWLVYRLLTACDMYYPMLLLARKREDRAVEST